MLVDMKPSILEKSAQFLFVFWPTLAEFNLRSLRVMAQLQMQFSLKCCISSLDVNYPTLFPSSNSHPVFEWLNYNSRKNKKNFMDWEI